MTKIRTFPAYLNNTPSKFPRSFHPRRFTLPRVAAFVVINNFPLLFTRIWVAIFFHFLLPSLFTCASLTRSLSNNRCLSFISQPLEIFIYFHRFDNYLHPSGTTVHVFILLSFPFGQRFFTLISVFTPYTLSGCFYPRAIYVYFLYFIPVLTVNTVYSSRSSQPCAVISCSFIH